MSLRKLALAGASAAAISLGAGTADASPVALELALVIDVSGSVNSTEYNLQVQGYKNAFLDATVQSNILSFAGSGGVAVSVVQFSTTAVTSIGWTLLTTAQQITSFANAIGAMARSGAVGSNTGIAAGMAMGLSLLNDDTFTGAHRVMDVSGDGVENVSTDSAVQQQRNNAAGAGILVNGLAIEGDFGANGVTNYYASNVITANGIVYTATSFNDFERAVIAKIGQEIIGVPEPMSLALFGMGLAGLGLMRRRAA